MKRTLCICLLFCHAATAQRSPLAETDKELFSKRFMRIFYDVNDQFENIKGNKKGGIYKCKVALPGARKGRIFKNKVLTYAVFTFPSFANYPDAEAGLDKLTSNIVRTLGERTKVKYLDTTSVDGLLKRNELCFSKSNGFYHHNVAVELSMDSAKAKPYTLVVQIDGGQPNFYYFISKAASYNSSPFYNYFRALQVKAEKHDTNTCILFIPGFDCNLKDSSGVKSVLLNKEVINRPEASVEFEATLANLKRAAGGTYLYYFDVAKEDELKRVVFFKDSDLDLKTRKSIVLTLVKTPERIYNVRLELYNP